VAAATKQEVEDSAPQPLGRREKRVWPHDPGAYTRNARKGGTYHPFIPDPIAKRAFVFDEVSTAAIAEATKALGHLDDTPPRIATLGAVARNLLRSESVASSRIEGVLISHRRLARAAYEGARKRHGDARAAEVLGNVEAMERAIEIGARATPLSVGDIQDIHRTLLRHTVDREIAGVIRARQNWIGGNDYTPVGAVYVPPPHEQIPGLLCDLCAFIERCDLPPIAQAAIAHAQFENIHPFMDGNGRTGRALIYTVLRRRGEIRNYIPPVSLVLANHLRDYVNGLGAYSEGRVSHWSTTFADAAARAAREAERLAGAIEQLQEQWLERLGQPRADATVRQLISALPAQPVIDVPSAQQLTDRSHVAVGSALRQLQDAGILKRLNERKWGRVWECDELLDLVGDFEQGISTP
jgi:Fic family protein